jgi:hypothetical protein
MKLETAFTMDTSSIKYGKGVTREIGYDMEEQGCRRVLVVTDPYLRNLEPVAVTLEALRARNIDALLFDQASVEPTDVSFKKAIAFAVNDCLSECAGGIPLHGPGRPGDSSLLRPVDGTRRIPRQAGGGR